VVEHLFSKQEALSSNSNIEKKTVKKKKEWDGLWRRLIETEGSYMIHNHENERLRDFWK
jgi:hypothetical protein